MIKNVLFGCEKIQKIIYDRNKRKIEAFKKRNYLDDLSKPKNKSFLWLFLKISKIDILLFNIFLYVIFCVNLKIILLKCYEKYQEGTFIDVYILIYVSLFFISIFFIIKIISQSFEISIRIKYFEIIKNYFEKKGKNKWKN